MVSVYDEKIFVVAGDGAYDRCGILGLSFKGEACRARLIKEIEVFVRNKELYRVAARYLTLRLYRDGIVITIVPVRTRAGGTCPMIWRTFSLLSSMLSMSFLLLSISQSHCCSYFKGSASLTYISKQLLSLTIAVVHQL